MTDTLTGMAVFASVVELGSFTKAADRLGMSKSAISKQVSRLEDRLGVQLMTRTTRRLSLTEAGESFYRSCARVVAEAEAAELERQQAAALERQIAALQQQHAQAALRLQALQRGRLGRRGGWRHRPSTS